MNSVKINPAGAVVTLEEGATLLEAIRLAGDIRFETPCNGRGTCGKCRIIVREGNLIPLTPSEQKALSDREIEDGFRLACCARVAGDGGTVVIELPGKEEKAVVLADADYAREVKAPLFAEKGERAFGIAIDIGTTTVASVLLDLQSGETLARTSAVNPQTEVGGDVLTRIAYTISNPETGLKNCQSLIVGLLNKMTDEMLAKTGLKATDICGYSIAANCTMLHLLLGVDPQTLSRAPFTPVFTEGQFLKANDIGLCPGNPEAGLYCLPSVSAYIGADIVAGIYMSGIDKTDKNIMFIDIGTNGEIVLSRGGKLFACSCAAGPAMEGMNISCGMRAAEGAVESVFYDDKAGRIAVRIIGEDRAFYGDGTAVPQGEAPLHGSESDSASGDTWQIPPVGICGSGVLESVAMLLKTRGIARDGKVKPKGSLIEAASYKDGKDKGYYICGGPESEKPIWFSQADVRQIQLAKGAILSGFTALIEKSGLTFDDLDEVIIAGQFGSHLKAETLADIGILPGETRNRVRYIGNSSLAGAISVFLDKGLVGVYEGLRQGVDYMELGTYKGYANLFMECLAFPEIAGQ